MRAWYFGFSIYRIEQLAYRLSRAPAQLADEIALADIGRRYYVLAILFIASLFLLSNAYIVVIRYMTSR